MANMYKKAERERKLALEKWELDKDAMTHKEIDLQNIEAEYNIKKLRAEAQVIFDCVTADVLRHDAYLTLGDCFKDRAISFVTRDNNPNDAMDAFAYKFWGTKRAIDVTQK